MPLGAIVIAPVFLARSIMHPEQLTHFTERLGNLPPGLIQRLGVLRRRPVWIQAVSVGEVVLARTLLEAIARSGRDTDDSIPCVLSSTTPAGRAAAAALHVAGLEGVFHFPIDWSPCVRRILGAVRPAALVCVETEIWPGLFARCASRRARHGGEILQEPFKVAPEVGGGCLKRRHGALELVGEGGGELVLDRLRHARCDLVLAAMRWLTRVIWG